MRCVVYGRSYTVATCTRRRTKPATSRSQPKPRSVRDTARCYQPAVRLLAPVAARPVPAVAGGQRLDQRGHALAHRAARRLAGGAARREAPGAEVEQER